VQHTHTEVGRSGRRLRRALAAVTAGLMALSLVAAADDDRDVTAELAIA
jgi:hypothetical protein